MVRQPLTQQARVELHELLAEMTWLELGSRRSWLHQGDRAALDYRGCGLTRRQVESAIDACIRRLA